VFACGGCFVVHSIFPLWFLIGLFFLLLELKIFLSFGAGNVITLVFIMALAPLVTTVVIFLLHGLILNYIFALYGGIIFLILLNAMELPKISYTIYLRVSLIFLGGIILLLLIPSLVFGKNIFIISRIQEQLTQCQVNLKTIGEAVEFYAKDNNGKFPEKLEDLTPKYLVKLPRCIKPLDNKWAEAIYRKREDLNFGDYYYEKFDNPPKFVIICRSNFHKKAFPERASPMYDSNQGIVY
jgi:hypothetical protein